MPIKYKLKKKAPKKVLVVKNKPSKAITFRNNVSLGKGLPKKIQSTHKFVYNGLLTTSGTSTVTTEEFFVNGMFKPVNSATTHQPMYFDQLLALYFRYTVIGSKITIKVIPDSSNSLIVSCFLNDTTSTIVPTTIQAMQEQTGSRYKIVSGGTGSPPYTVNMNWSARKRFGKGVLANSELAGANNANPTLDPTYVLAITDFSAIAAVIVRYSVEIEYIAVWTNLRDIDGS